MASLLYQWQFRPKVSFLLRYIKQKSFSNLRLVEKKKNTTFALQNKKNGTLAQVVEQWTENPCVLGSTPRGTTPPFISPVRESGRGLIFY